MQERKAEFVLKRTMNMIKEEFPLLIPAVNLFTLKVVDEALEQLAGKSRESIALSTDGEFLFYHPDNVLETFQRSGFPGVRYQLMHVLLHCILGHLEMDGFYKNQKLLWVVLDREVGHWLTELKLDAYSYSCAGHIQYMDSFLGECYDMGCYFRAQKDWLLRRKILDSKEMLHVDCHEFWRIREKQAAAWGGQSEEGVVGQCRKSGEESAEGQGTQAGEEGAEGQENQGAGGGKNAAEWGKLRSRFFSGGGTFDRESFLKELKNNHYSGYGSGSSSETERIKAAKENENSYYHLLMQLLQNCETAKVPPDAIDYTLYQYGLELYGDVPLIEPPDCEEWVKLNTICLAIDTSGSCSKRVAEHFLRETRNILRDIGRISQGGELYFFQCDDKLQSEEYYDSLEKMLADEEEGTELRGFGGTSFVPVFERVRELQEQDNKTIDCLIYLTDAYGEYPEQKPDYPVFFILPGTVEQIEGDSYWRERIPKWIQKVGLESE